MNIHKHIQHAFRVPGSARGGGRQAGGPSALAFSVHTHAQQAACAACMLERVCCLQCKHNVQGRFLVELSTVATPVPHLEGGGHAEEVGGAAAAGRHAPGGAHAAAKGPQVEGGGGPAGGFVGRWVGLQPQGWRCAPAGCQPARVPALRLRLQAALRVCRLWRQAAQAARRAGRMGLRNKAGRQVGGCAHTEQYSAPSLPAGRMGQGRVGVRGAAGMPRGRCTPASNAARSSCSRPACRACRQPRCAQQRGREGVCTCKWRG